MYRKVSFNRFTTAAWALNVDYWESVGHYNGRFGYSQLTLCARGLARLFNIPSGVSQIDVVVTDYNPTRGRSIRVEKVGTYYAKFSGVGMVSLQPLVAARLKRIYGKSRYLWVTVYY